MRFLIITVCCLVFVNARYYNTRFDLPRRRPYPNVRSWEMRDYFAHRDAFPRRRFQHPSLFIDTERADPGYYRRISPRFSDELARRSQRFYNAFGRRYNFENVKQESNSVPRERGEFKSVAPFSADHAAEMVGKPEKQIAKHVPEGNEDARYPKDRESSAKDMQREYRRYRKNFYESA